MMLSFGLLIGGIIDHDKYDTVSGTLKTVWGCESICRDFDGGGGGGGGGGGEKRNTQDIRCQGAQFTCIVEWKHGDDTYTSKGIDAQWDSSDYSCGNVVSGASSAVVFQKSEPSVAVDVLPPGQTRTAVLLIVGIVFLTVTLCVGLAAAFFCMVCKRNGAQFDTV